MWGVYIYNDIIIQTEGVKKCRLSQILRTLTCNTQTITRSHVYESRDLNKGNTQRKCMVLYTCHFLKHCLHFKICISEMMSEEIHFCYQYNHNGCSNHISAVYNVHTCTCTVVFESNYFKFQLTAITIEH